MKKAALFPVLLPLFIQALPTRPPTPRAVQELLLNHNTPRSTGSNSSTDSCPSDKEALIHGSRANDILFKGLYAAAEQCYLAPFDSPLHGPDLARKMTQFINTIMQTGKIPEKSDDRDLSYLIRPCFNASYAKAFESPCFRQLFSYMTEKQSPPGQQRRFSLTLGRPSQQPIGSPPTPRHKRRSSFFSRLNTDSGDNRLFGIKAFPPLPLHETMLLDALMAACDGCALDKVTPQERLAENVYLSALVHLLLSRKEESATLYAIAQEEAPNKKQKEELLTKSVGLLVAPYLENGPPEKSLPNGLAMQLAIEFSATERSLKWYEDLLAINRAINLKNPHLCMENYEMTLQESLRNAQRKRCQLAVAREAVHLYVINHPQTHFNAVMAELLGRPPSK